MTKLPSELRDVIGVDGPEYDLNMVCAAPGCQEIAVDTHHIWRRSAVGNHAWVTSSMWEGRRGNLVRLCRLHHEQLTVNAAWLRYDPETEAFWWDVMLGVPRQLEWSPPSTASTEPSLNSENPDTPASNGVCPSCKRPLPHVHKGPPQPRRPRRTWSVTVPVDERENGAEILDGLLEASREMMAQAGLPYGDESAVRYFVLSAALGLFVQHGLEVMSDS